MTNNKSIVVLFIMIYFVIDNFDLFFIFIAEGLVGIAVAGGVIVGLASILGLGIAMAKKS